MKRQGEKESIEEQDKDKLDTLKNGFGSVMWSKLAKYSTVNSNELSEVNKL